MMKLTETKHSYYCSESNYYSSEGACEYGTWGDFKDEWGIDNIDHDLNFLFRFDIGKHDDDYGDDLAGKYYMQLFIMLS